MKGTGDRHRRRGRNNRARLRDKNGNGRENVAARTWKDVARRGRSAGDRGRTEKNDDGPRARGPGEMCGRNFFSKSIHPHRRFLEDYELLYPSFTQHTVRRGRRPQRLPKIVVRARARGNVDEDFPVRGKATAESRYRKRSYEKEKGRGGGREGMNEREKVRERERERRQIITYIRVISDSRNVAQLLVSVSGMKLRFRVSRNR
ncbi:hypothetical protein ALC62_07908 [Cyphomyrmex costatus]|uniref:Uncharacterized protein n=1 Tax=Cyphomyrmex costatus TaxID=456900 RepID=A0A195CMJ4_9HYME|nr:hypothetical protein ALC62_07908 [Cyphomyrmex costatus]